jgi:hypothetical protein
LRIQADSLWRGGLAQEEPTAARKHINRYQQTNSNKRSSGNRASKTDTQRRHRQEMAASNALI